MSPAYLHLISSHVPVLGTFFGFCLLSLGLLRRSEELKRAALLVFVAVALLAWPAYLSGSPASGALRRFMPGASMDAEDQHSEIAVLALVGSQALGVVSLTGLILFRKGRHLRASFLGFVLLLALLASGLLGWAANLGVKIRHPEVRPQASTDANRQTSPDVTQERGFLCV